MDFFAIKNIFSCSFHFFLLWFFFIATCEKEKDVRWEGRERGTAGLQDLCAGGISVNANAKTAGRQCSMRCKETIP